jgi:hypothetical protein
LTRGDRRERGRGPERLAVYTTVYPGVEKFLCEWHKSLRDQTYQDFDLWIGSDGVDPAMLTTLLGENAATCVTADPHITPAGIRQQAIAQMVEQYAAVVFVDSDDIMAPSRIAAAREALEKLDVSACALRIVNEDSQDLGLIFGPPSDVDWDGFLPRYNVFGLSNTAYRSEVLRRCLPLPREAVLIDWLLVTRAWSLGASLGFDQTPRMFYRQYAANVARVLPPFTPAGVRHAAERVLEHYRFALETESWPLPQHQRESLESVRQRAATFHRAIADPERLNRYVEALNALPPRYVWCWTVAHPDLEAIWRN